MTQYNNIEANLIEQYSSNVQLLAQQKNSKLLNHVMTEVATGKRSYFDQYGVHDDMSQVTTRFKDYDLKDIESTRRAVDIVARSDTRGVDNFDKIRMLADMENSIVMAQAAQAAREIDKDILKAARGSALTGATGATSVSLPSGQKVAIDSHEFSSAIGDAFMTRSKAQEAMAILADNSFVEDEMVFVLDGKNYQSLISEDQASSTRYVEYRPFESGVLPYFLGAAVIQLPKSSFELNSTTGIYNICFAKSAMLSVAGKDGLILSDIFEDKNKEMINTHVIKTNLFHAATRMQEEGVVEIENKQ